MKDLSVSGGISFMAIILGLATIFVIGLVFYIAFAKRDR